MVGSYVMKVSANGQVSIIPEPARGLVLAGRLIGCSSSISVIAW